MRAIPTTFATPLPAAGNSGWEGLFPNALLPMFWQPFMTPDGQVPERLGLQAAMLRPCCWQQNCLVLTGMPALPTPGVWVSSSKLKMGADSPRTPCLSPAHSGEWDVAREQVSGSLTLHPCPDLIRAFCQVPPASPSSSRGCHAHL